MKRCLRVVLNGIRPPVDKGANLGVVGFIPSDSTSSRGTASPSTQAPSLPAAAGAASASRTRGDELVHHKASMAALTRTPSGGRLGCTSWPAVVVAETVRRTSCAEAASRQPTGGPSVAPAFRAVLYYELAGRGDTACASTARDVPQDDVRRTGQWAASAVLLALAMSRDATRARIGRERPRAAPETAGRDRASRRTGVRSGRGADEADRSRRDRAGHGPTSRSQSIGAGAASNGSPTRRT